MNMEQQQQEGQQNKPKVMPLPNGPYYLLNDMTPKVVPNLQSSDGKPLSNISGTALCRCGASKNKPFCDGTHVTIKFLSDNKIIDETGQKFKDKKKEPLLEKFPLVELEDLLEQKSIDIDIPQLDKVIESNAKVPAINVDEEQYKFVLDDLEKASKNKNIDWIIVMFHKPMYSSLSKQLEEYIMRDKYQPLFDKYNVDLVISGHNHIYSRTLPLSFNKANISQPIVDQHSTGNNYDDNNYSNNNTTFTNPNGTTFLVVGVGGAELHRITEEQYYIANQYNKGFGFVDLNIDGKKKLDGTFYDISLYCKTEITEKKKKEVIDLESCVPAMTNNNNNNLKVIDQFTIQKSH